jgi:hypothetical protein
MLTTVQSVPTFTLADAPTLIGQRCRLVFVETGRTVEGEFHGSDKPGTVLFHMDGYEYTARLHEDCFFWVE